MRVADDTGTRRARDSARGFQKVRGNRKEVGFWTFSIVSLLIKRTPSYKVRNNFAAITIHFVREHF